MARVSALRQEERDILGILRAKHPRNFWVKLYRCEQNKPKVQIPATDSSVYHPIQPAQLTEIDQWLADNPLAGPGFAYAVEIYPEDDNGNKTKKPLWSKTFDPILSTAQALELAAPQFAREAEAREQAARLGASASLDTLVRVATEETPRLSEAMQMAATPDPVQQNAALQTMAAMGDRLASALTGFTTSSAQLQAALAQPRPSAPVPTPVAPIPAPVAPQPHYAPPFGGPAAPAMGVGMPQLVQLPGYGPMALINGQLVPVQPQQQQKAESETEKLLRAVLEGQLRAQQAPQAPAVDPALREELRRLQERTERAEREALQARQDAERRAIEAERKAEQLAHEAELRRIQAESDAKIAALRVEMSALANKGNGGDREFEFLKMLQDQRRESDRQMAELQKAQADRDARQQERLDAIRDRQIEQLEAQASAGPTDQIRAITSTVTELAGMTTQMVTSAARAAMIGQPAKGSTPPSWLPMAEKMIDQLGAVGLALTQGAAATIAPPPEPSAMPEHQLPALPAPMPGESAPEATRETPMPQPISLDAARMVDDARRHAIDGRLAAAFTALDRAFQANPTYLEQGGTDDLRELRAGMALLAGYMPEGVTETDILSALVSAKGPGIVALAMRLAREINAQRATAPATIEAPTPDPAPHEDEAIRAQQENE